MTSWHWGEEENLKLRSIMSRESVDYHSGEWLIGKLAGAIREIGRLRSLQQLRSLPVCGEFEHPHGSREAALPVDEFGNLRELQP